MQEMGEGKKAVQASISQRLKQFIEYKGMSLNKFSHRAGLREALEAFKKLKVNVPEKRPVGRPRKSTAAKAASPKPNA